MDLKQGTYLTPPNIKNFSCTHSRYVLPLYYYIGPFDVIQAILIFLLTIGIIGANLILIFVINHRRYSPYIHPQVKIMQNENIFKHIHIKWMWFFFLFCFMNYFDVICCLCPATLFTYIISIEWFCYWNIDYTVRYFTSITPLLAIWWNFLSNSGELCFIYSIFMKKIH